MVEKLDGMELRHAHQMTVHTGRMVKAFEQIAEWLPEMVEAAKRLEQTERDKLKAEAEAARRRKARAARRRREAAEAASDKPATQFISVPLKAEESENLGVSLLRYFQDNPGGVFSVANLVSAVGLDPAKNHNKVSAAVKVLVDAGWVTASWPRGREGNARYCLTRQQDEEEL